MDGLIAGRAAALDIAYSVLEAGAHAMLALDQLTLARVRPTVGAVYAIDLGEYGALDLTLLAADGHGESPVDGADVRRPFSLEFRGPLDPQLGQATYQLVHAELGSLAAFLVPIARDSEGLRYRAIFG